MNARDEFSIKAQKLVNEKKLELIAAFDAVLIAGLKHTDKGEFVITGIVGMDFEIDTILKALPVRE